MRFLRAAVAALLLAALMTNGTAAVSSIAINSPLPVNYGERLILGWALDGADVGCEANLSFHVTVTANGTTVTDQFGGGIVFDATKRVSVGTAKQRTSFTMSGGSEWSAGGGDAAIDLLCSGNVIASTSLTIEP